MEKAQGAGKSLGDESPPIAAGEIVAEKYRIERLVGQGGMGVVYKATKLDDGGVVALKFLRFDRRDLVARFTREARAIVQLQNRHVVRVLDVGGLETKTPFLVLEYLEGETLEEALERSGPFSGAGVAQIGVEACRALEAAHAVGIIHRDVKPSNLFWAHERNGSAIVKLLDFGASKLRDGNSSDQTSHHTLIGSPGYASPEQLMNPHDLDERTDVWSLGVTLYTLASGQPPFSSPLLAQTFMRIMSETPTPLHHLSSTVDPALSQVIAKCLHKDRAERYPTAATLAEALSPFARQAYRATTEPRAPPAPQRARASDSVVDPPSARKTGRTRTALVTVVATLALAGLTSALALKSSRSSTGGESSSHSTPESVASESAPVFDPTTIASGAVLQATPHGAAPPVATTSSGAVKAKSSPKTPGRASGVRRSTSERTLPTTSPKDERAAPSSFSSTNGYTSKRHD